MLTFPDIDPVLIQIGPLAIRWYGLAYLAGLFFGFRLASPYLKRLGLSVDRQWDFLLYLMGGIILGGRLGYILVYDFVFYFSNPGNILAIWNGGMSFHGGIVGAALGSLLFARRHQVSVLSLWDCVSLGAPIGLFFGRIANFINGELFGRVTMVPWGMVFPFGGPLPRHPSQLYEAVLEGVLLLCVMKWAMASGRFKPGQPASLFMAGYGVCRFGVDFFREPDVQMGLLWGGVSMGQLLSLVMVGIGAGVFFWISSQKAVSRFFS